MTKGLVGKLGREYKPQKTEEEVLRFWQTNYGYEKNQEEAPESSKVLLPRWEVRSLTPTLF